MGDGYSVLEMQPDIRRFIHNNRNFKN